MEKHKRSEEKKSFGLKKGKRNINILSSRPAFK